MDAQYLKLNVFDALTEALTAMAATTPEDKVEFIANYLLKYVERKKLNEEKLRAINEAEIKYQQKIKDDLQVQIEVDKKMKAENDRKGQLTEFLSSFYFGSTIVTKKDAMDHANKFISEYLNIPAVYTAFKKTVSEQEYLYYYSASSEKQVTKIVGKKLPKPSIEFDPDDDTTHRQGISFDAFLVPEVPEADEEELDENGDPKPPVPPPKPQPLIVENVVREKRMKYFGIPKLGSYVAVPLSYDSSDHETGYQIRSRDDVVEGEVDPKSGNYITKFIKQDFIMAFDSIGEYRTFTEEEIEIVKKIGSAMIKIFEQIERKTIEQQKLFLDLQTSLSESVNRSIHHTIADESQLPPIVIEESSDPEAPAPLASLKPYRESLAALQLWSSQLTADPLANALKSLHGHVLPLPLNALNLLYVTFLAIGYPASSLVDQFGDVSWEKMRPIIKEELVSKIWSYDPNNRTISREGSLESLKAFIEANNITDASNLPSHLPVLPAVLTWLQRVITAREAVIAYHSEAHEEEVFEIIRK